MPKEILNTIVGVFGSTISYMYGGWSAVLELLMILVVLDYVSGMAAATIEGKLASSVGFKGIAKKIAIFAVIFVGHKLDIALDLNDWMMNIAAFFYISNEFLSLTENLGRMGVPIPEPMKKAVSQLKDRGGNRSA